MANLTLANLTYEVARAIGSGVLVEGTATGGTTNTIVDNVERVVDAETDDYWNGGTMWVTYDAGGASAAPEWEYDIIYDFTSTTGTITARTGFTAAVAAGDRYALCKKRFPQQVLVQNVNRALQDLDIIPVVDSTTITIASSQTEYSITVDASMDLRAVLIQGDTGDTDDNRWSELKGWRIEVTATGTADKLILPRQYTSGKALQLVYAGYHPELKVYSDKLCEGVHKNRVVFQAAAYCMEWYMNKTSSDMYADSYVRMLARAEEAKAKHPVKLPPRPSVKIFTFSRDYSQEDEPGKVYL